MEYEYIKNLKDTNPALRLLKVDNSPLIISFLFNAFKRDNNYTMLEGDLENKLSDYLYHINHDEEIYSGEPKSYLRKWADDGFLRAWYESDNDIPTYELTPATETAFEWIVDLNKKEFIGTESRLLSIYSILREITVKTTPDPIKRIRELEKQKKKIDAEIHLIRAGNLEVLDETKVKERFFEVEDIARKLLSDFKQIEQNFRELDNEIRIKQIGTNLSRGKILDEIFSVQDLIWNSDQGKSFKSFWELLMSQSKQEELNELIETVLELPELEELKDENIIARLKVNLVEAGDKVNKTNSIIIEQLRKYLDDRLFIENRRIMDIINSIETLAVKVKQKAPIQKDFTSIDDKLKMDFTMDRPLFNPPKILELNTTDFNEGKAEISTNSLYNQLYINPDELRLRIRDMLKHRQRVSLKEITERYPIEKGMAEVITYFSLATKSGTAIINEDSPETILIFSRDSGKYLEVEMPQTIFCK